MEVSLGVIVVNYKTPEKTERCVKSLLASIYNNFLVYIVDNGSQGSDTEYFKKAFKNNCKVKLILQEKNFGYGGAVNRAFEKLKNRHGLFLISNSDIFYDRDALSQLINAVEKGGEGNVYFPVTMFPGSQKTILSAGLNSFIPSPFQMKFFGKRIVNTGGFVEAPYLGGSSFLIGRDLFEKAGGFDEEYFLYGEDIDLGLRIKKTGGKFFAVTASKIWHEFHGSTSRFSPLSRYYLARNVPRIINKHMSWKVWYYFQFYWWSFWSLLMLFFSFRWRSIFYFCLGTVDFLRGKRGALKSS